MAFAGFLFHQYYFAMPNACLTFDAQGYLMVTNGCLQALRPEVGHQVISYIANGFHEGDRIALVQALGPAADLVKSGPIMPIVMGLPLLLLHKQAMSFNWQVVMVTMYGLQAISVGLIWAIARKYWGVAESRVAAVVAMFYPGFVINGGHALSEIPACAAVLLAAWMVIELFANERTDERANARRYHIKAITTGFVLALVTLARPTLLPLPVVLLTGLFCLSKALPSANFAWKSNMVALAAGALLCLAPWCAVKYVLTGHPSITIDRYGAYNFVAGMDTATDGLDIVSTGFVAHPDQFKLGFADVLTRVYRSAAANPLAFADMMIRKPMRLVEGPWNDFSVRSWTFPPAWQTWWHRILFLMALLGVINMSVRALKSRSFLKAAPTTVLGVIVGFHFISCLFIAMHRYMYTALPAVIILAAVETVALYRELDRAQLFALALATAAFPAVCSLVDLFSSDQTPLLPWTAAQLGIELTSILVAAAVAVVALFWCLTAFALTGRARTAGLRPPLQLTAWVIASIFLMVGCFASTYHSLRTMEYNQVLDARNGSITVNFATPKPLGTERYFILADCHSESVQPRPLRSIAASIDGHSVAGEFAPLFAIDQSQRENLMYARTIAAASGTEVEAIRQWWCLPIQAKELPQSSEMTVTLTNGSAGNSTIYIGADYFSSGTTNHELSITEFSWTKGFMANHPGEMRMDVWGKAGYRPPLQQQIRPRIYLLCVRQEAITDSASVSIERRFPDALISPKLSQQMARYELNDLATLPRQSAIKVTTSGIYRAVGRKSGEASVCMVEHVERDGETGEQLAPLAPSVLKTMRYWQPFKFCDYVPLSNFASARLGSLRSLDVLVFGRPWYEALQYATVRPRSTTEFRDIKTEVESVSLIDLQHQQWRLVRPTPQQGDSREEADKTKCRQ
ncbi:MAG TPA: hypothetical protein V6D22_24430 [Candidatus Obscuribacterales bacterium]